MRSRKQISRTLTGLLAGVLTASVLSACSPTTSSVDNTNPVNTGSMEAESEYGSLTSEQTVRGLKVFVASDNLRLRTSPEVKDDNIAGTININDQLEVADSARIGQQEFIAVKVVSSSNTALVGKTLYTSANYLSTTQTQKFTEAQHSAGKEHFVVINVATEMIRLYEKGSSGAKNKMLMEFHGTVGDNSDERRSDVGVYKATQWTKFYEVPGEYAGWYRPGYPELPKVGSRGSWLSKKSSPPGFSGPRGAFGWFTVFVGPNPHGQWMHGTTGWGADKNNMVRFQDSFMGGIVDIFAKLGSHGCTRLSNEAIAFMRSNFRVGDTLIKVYAKEGVKDRSLAGYPAAGQLGHFPYIITKVGYGKQNGQHETAARDVVINDGTPKEQWLEEGTFDYDQTPSPAGGDHYKLHKFAGVLNVDEGTLSSDYRHPIDGKLTVGGYPGKESAIPSFARSSDSSASSQLMIVDKDIKVDSEGEAVENN